jgi:hypothetical protein
MIKCKICGGTHGGLICTLDRAQAVSNKRPPVPVTNAVTNVPVTPPPVTNKPRKLFTPAERHAPWRANQRELMRERRAKAKSNSP